MSERRWRVLLNVTVFVAATGAMVLLSMSHRDAQAVQTCREQMDYTCQELQKLLETGQVAPRSLPLPLPPEPGEGASAAEKEKWQSETLAAREHYFYNSQYATTRSGGQTVGVCCCKNTHHLFLRANGRHVVVFDGQKYEVRWLTEAELRQQAASWNLTSAQITALGLHGHRQP